MKRLTKDERDQTLVLYPGPDAHKLEDLETNKAYNIVIIDGGLSDVYTCCNDLFSGTWNQAKGIFHNSPDLQSLKKVQVNVDHPSTYVIRTQPLEGCLSTVETAALALAFLETNQSIYEALMKPLNALCQFQLQHGAVVHSSTERMVTKGAHPLWKPIPKELKKKLKLKNQQKTNCLGKFWDVNDTYDA